MSTLLQTDRLEDPNPNGEFDSTSYPDRPQHMCPIRLLLLEQLQTFSRRFLHPLDHRSNAT